MPDASGCRADQSGRGAVPDVSRCGADQSGRAALPAGGTGKGGGPDAAAVGQGAGPATATAVGRRSHREAAPADRRAEFAAAQLLFFACVPPRPVPLDVLTVLRGWAVCAHWGSAEVRYAVQVLQALTLHDAASFLRLAARPPTRLISDIVTVKAGAARTALVRVWACVYRSLPWTPAVEMMGIGKQHKASAAAVLESALKDAAEQGCRGAAVALQALSGQGGSASLALPVPNAWDDDEKKSTVSSSSTADLSLVFKV